MRFNYWRRSLSGPHLLTLVDNLDVPFRNVRASRMFPSCWTVKDFWVDTGLSMSLGSKSLLPQGTFLVPKNCIEITYSCLPDQPGLASYGQEPRKPGACLPGPKKSGLKGKCL